MKKTAKVLFVLAGILMIFVMLITAIEIFSFNPSFYADEYDKLKQADVIGMSREDLKAVTNNLLNYTKGERINLDMQYAINGQVREVFNPKEKTHMVDVKRLYLNARDFRNIGLIVAILFIAAGILLYKKGAVKLALNCYLWVCGAFFFVIAALGIWAAIDFYSFWTSFHLLFFSNNLWLLDPATDVLIMMVPEEFFFDLVFRIIFLFASAFAASIIVSFLAKWFIKRKERLAA